MERAAGDRHPGPTAAAMGTSAVRKRLLRWPSGSLPQTYAQPSEFRLQFRQRRPAEILDPQQLRWTHLDQLSNGSNPRMLQAVVEPHAQFQFVDRDCQGGGPLHPGHRSIRRTTLILQPLRVGAAALNPRKYLAHALHSYPKGGSDFPKRLALLPSLKDLGVARGIVLHLRPVLLQGLVEEDPRHVLDAPVLIRGELTHPLPYRPGNAKDDLLLGDGVLFLLYCHGAKYGRVRSSDASES